MRTLPHLLCVLTAVLISLPLDAQTLIDSLEHKLTKATSDTVKINLLNQLVRSTLLNHTDQALDFAHHFDSLAQKIQNGPEMARGKNFIGMCHQVGNRPDSAIHYYLLSLKQYEVLNDTLYQGILLNNIGSCNGIRGLPKESINYYRQALEKFEAVENPEWIANALNNLGTEYAKLKQYEEAIIHQKRALPYYERLDKHYEAAVANSNIGNNYVKLENWQGALTHFNRSVVQMPENYDYGAESFLYSGLGLTQLNLENYVEAKNNLIKSIELAERNRLFEEAAASYAYLAEYYQKTGNYLAAIEALKSQMTYRDSMIRKEQDEAMVLALQEFEAEKKDREIGLLNELSRAQAAKIESSQRQRLLMILGLVLLAVIAVLIYRQLRLKRRFIAIMDT